MPSDRECFHLTGPTFLTAVDWSNSHHRRSVAASLVQGVYTMERDRLAKRQGPHALAPPWWEFFGFKLIELLVDSHDLSIFGAIYEFRFMHVHSHAFSAARPPQYVIAFRGTIRKTGTWEQDFKLNLHCIFNNLHNCTRFTTGLQWARNMAYKAPAGSIWLAGHSLGSSIALLVGRQMIKELGIHLQTYLFNSPFPSPPLERLSNDKLKLGLRLPNSLITAGLATLTKSKESDPFVALSTWIPYLFLNPSDPICSEYIGYFKQRENMEAIGAGKIGRIATKHSIRSIMAGIFGKGKDCDAAHLIPCAYLTINSSPGQSFKESHGIHQWWRQDLQLQYKLYQYK